MASQRTARQSGAAELVFGMINPVGVDREPVHAALHDALKLMGYQTVKVKISEFLTSYANYRGIHWSAEKQLDRKHRLMDAGNDLRALYKSGDAGALVAITKIQQLRRKKVADGARGVAYVIDSLKHPAEVERLRAIYGPAFVAVATYAPVEQRRKKIESDLQTLLDSPSLSDIEYLMARDEEEEDKLGQRVRDAFQLADIVVDVSLSDSVQRQIRRIVELLFGNVQLTPSLIEYGMALARSAQLRSGSLARQIGAAILFEEGSIAAIGANDVAKPGGGQYWEADDARYQDGRDIRREVDSSDLHRHRAITDMLALLQKNKKLPQSKTAQQLFEEWFHQEGWLKKAKFTSTIDYIRAVHAEMAALTDAARRGISVRGCILFTTTFPCHDCAKHIVAAGISEVIYLAPYPKSLVAELYSDSVEINSQLADGGKVQFRSFVGIAPSRYGDFFSIGKRERKDSRGRPVHFSAAKAKIALPEFAPAFQTIRISEQTASEPFVAQFKRVLNPSKRKIRRKRA